MKEMDNFELSRMSWVSISQVKYEENIEALHILYPKFEQEGEGYRDTYYRGRHFVLIDKKNNKSRFVLSEEASKCHCGCEHWDYEDKLEIVPENIKRDSRITLLVKKDVAENEKGRRKVTYCMHPKFHELVEGSLDALLLVNLGKIGGEK